MRGSDNEVQVRNKEIIRCQFEDVWNQGRVDLISTYWDADLSNFGELRSLDHLRLIVETWRTAFPDLHFTVDEQLAEGDQVFSHCTLTGTHLGVFMHPSWGTLPPTGKQFTVKHMHLFRLHDGKIVEHWAVRDDLGMLRQLGMALAGVRVAVRQKTPLRTGCVVAATVVAARCARKSVVTAVETIKRREE